MKYVAWVPIKGLLKVEIESEYELKKSEIRREIMRYMDMDENPDLGTCETLKKLSTHWRPQSIKIKLEDGDMSQSKHVS